MSQTALEARAETLVHEAIDDIADELGISVEGYPAVIYIPRNKRKKNSTSEYIIEKEKIILVDLMPETAGEEATHFIHYTLAQPSLKKTKWDYLTWHALTEAFGFFGSKLLAPQRKLTGHYSTVPSLLKNKKT